MAPSVVWSPDRGPRLLVLVRRAIRLRHYSRRTEEAYVAWVRRFVRFCGLRHPAELGRAEVTAFLSHLAEREGLSAASQNQAASALGFLYEGVLGRRLPAGGLEGMVRAKEPGRLPVVLTRDEVCRVLAELRGVNRLVVLLLYGSGLRLLEALELRVKDVDFERGEIRVRSAKGGGSRVTMLAVVAAEPLRAHLVRVRRLHESDRAPSSKLVVSSVITGTSPRSSERSAGRSWAPGSRSGRRVTLSGTRSPRIFSRRGTTSEPCRSSSAIVTCGRPWCIPTSSIGAG